MGRSLFENVWLFLPCLNEEGNLAEIVEAILNLRIDRFHIAIVVDRSTDRTEAIADELHVRFPEQVFALHRQPPGSRALAGKDAFLFCLERGADVIIEMDADFSHDPKYIPLMLQELADPGVDVVLGSRFLPGGSDADRSPFRTFISRLSGVIFRFILGIRLTDMGSGFKAYKRAALESIDPRNLFSEKGLAISMESIFRVLKNGYAVKEIPIIFVDRRVGVSKLSWKDFFEPIFISLRLVRAFGRFQKTGTHPAGSSPSTHSGRPALSRTAWWWGTALLAGIASALPYWLWGAFGAEWGWSALGRIPVAPNAVFDSYAYFQEMGLLKAGLPMSAFGWFAWPLLGLMSLLPSASIPELWVISRWVTTLLTFWAGAWCIRGITGAEKGVSRWLIVCFWLSFLLVIGLRPGVFSWDLPFGFAGLGLTALAADAMDRGAWGKALAYGFAALGLFAVYPWFLIYGALLLAALFLSSVIRRKPRQWIFLVAAAALVICGVGVLIANGTLPLRLPASFAAYERNGMTFSFMPMISNTVLACGLWLGLFLFAPSRRGGGQNRAANLLGWFWITVLAAWLSSPLTGVYLQSDHFIIIAAMLAWVTAAFFTAPACGDERSPLPLSRGERLGAFCIAAFASLFFLYILRKAVWNLGQFETYTIHLSIWLALAWSAWLHWFRARGANMSSLWLKARCGLLIICLLLGVTGLRTVILRGMKEMPELKNRITVIHWIKEHVPSREAICSDPVNASAYGAHIARQAYPEESNMVLPDSDAVLLRRLMVIGGAYDVVAAGDERRYLYYVNGIRTAACEQFVSVARLLGRLNFSKASVDAFLGCRQERADAFWNEVTTSLAMHRTDPAAFRKICPWVVIPDDRKPYWNLPGSYEEIRVDERTSVWHAE